LIKSEFWKNEIQAKFLIGILTADDGVSEYLYMLPEIIIICSIMINEIKLKLIGLYDQVESEVEDVTEAMIRINEKGDD
jgi:hypothetical protein